MHLLVFLRRPGGHGSKEPNSPGAPNELGHLEFQDGHWPSNELGHLDFKMAIGPQTGLAILTSRWPLALKQAWPSWLQDGHWPSAGWGWFVDPTPGDDSEFTTPGNQGEQHRMDLLTVLAHEIGHLLGQEHALDGVMIDTLATGVRRMPRGATDWLAAVDLLFSEVSFRKRR